MLVSHQESTQRIKYKLLHVIGTEESMEYVLGDCKGRQVLDVRVVINRVADNVVYVVRPFPPGDGDSSAEVTSQNS